MPTFDNRFTLNSYKEVRLICILQVEAECSALLAGPKREVLKVIELAYANHAQRVRSLIPAVDLRKLGVLDPEKPSARASSKHTASYTMVQRIWKSVVDAARKMVTHYSCEHLQHWFTDEIDMLQHELYHQDHVYKLDFSNFPCMGEWVGWSAYDDHDADEGDDATEVNGAPVQLLSESLTEDDDDDDDDYDDEEAYESDDTSSSSGESSDASGEESEAPLDTKTTRSKSRRNDAVGGMPEVVSILMHVANASSRSTRMGKTPASKALMSLLSARKKGGANEITSYFEGLSKEDQTRVLQTLQRVNAEKHRAPLLIRILTSNLTPDIKHEIMSRCEAPHGEENAKSQARVNTLLKMPFDKYITPQTVAVATSGNAREAETFLTASRAYLDEVVYGHKDAKDLLVQFIAQMMRQARVEASAPTADPLPSANGSMTNDAAPPHASSTPTLSSASTHKGLVLGIQGPFGNGKTTLIEHGISKVMGLPFAAIPLGGATDGAMLTGHGYTYEGSTHGQIADVLMKTGCMNPIIYMDELDKVSRCYKGQEIINQLVHMTDPSQNFHFRDKYLGNIDIDLSRVTWVFSYNDRGNIPPVLRDRITEVRTSGFTLPQKEVIATQFLVPSICKEIGIPAVHVASDVVAHLVERYTYEGGVRGIKKLLFEVCRKLNMDDLCGKINLATASKRRRVTRRSNTLAVTASSDPTPYEVSLKTVQAYLAHHTPMQREHVHARSEIGRIIGLYASSGVDMGGIIPIETKFVPSDSVYGLSLTGNLGKVMQESGMVAKTLALQCTTMRVRRRWEDRWKSVKESIHVHCPEGAMSKDGPSAGTALTTAILSLLTGNKIRHNVGITGEINLSGEVMAIGGLRSKLYGAKSAGCIKVLYPKDNRKDVIKITRECPDLFHKGFEAVAVATLSDVLPHVLMGFVGVDVVGAGASNGKSATGVDNAPSEQRCRKRSRS